MERTKYALRIDLTTMGNEREECVTSKFPARNALELTRMKVESTIRPSTYVPLSLLSSYVVNERYRDGIGSEVRIDILCRRRKNKCPRRQ